MTLGGLALAVGILVDEGTVVIENVHSHLGRRKDLAQATYDGTVETRVPNFLAMLCILAVFIPAFFMQGAARNLFIPLALAVGFAMIASYLLSRTLVPVLVVWLLRQRARARGGRAHAAFDRFRDSYRTTRGPHRGAAAGGRDRLPADRRGDRLVCRRQSGPRDFSDRRCRAVRASAARLRRARGSRKPKSLPTRRSTSSPAKSAPDNIEISLGFVGVQNAAYPINTIHLWTSGPEEAVMQVQLNRKSGYPRRRVAGASAQGCCRRNCPASASASSPATSSAR